jgi:hypothetical protein
MKEDCRRSILCIKSPARQSSPGQGLDAAQDSGPQIDLTKNLEKRSTVKRKIPMATATVKEKKQAAGITKKLQAETTNPNIPSIRNFRKKLQAETTNPNIPSIENFGKPVPKLIDTQAKKLAIENPEAKQNKAKIIKVGKIQQKTGLTIVRDETPTPYNYYHH